jgi:hypothetical protein
VGVGVGDVFGWFADCPNIMYAPMPIRTIATMPIAMNNVLLDLLLDLFLFLGAMSVYSTAFHIKVFIFSFRKGVESICAISLEARVFYICYCGC